MVISRDLTEYLGVDLLMKFLLHRLPKDFGKEKIEI